MNILNNSTNQLLESALNASMTRQRTISNNIANVDTPGFKAEKTLFKDEMLHASDRKKFAANRTDPRHQEFGGSIGDYTTVMKSRGTSMNQSGNNVDLDYEMAKMAENQLYFQALSDRMNGRFNSIQMVLGKGR
ncbi:flagellar basal body rod protein FlgB [Alteribacter lacisalsi]|uniref:Flagellar basal body rod protein FlgB n=1 Tax=Alteribacter lacisalsi TaxID=2045244 RepID=A0A2W0H818_9BACI|nr:flagellar basal body rod protein FlgB [Alteribacter lacisalsi]PYZ98013.1 flagellar basal body rod protein FlgB [Alteribacter lacisalsi]